MKQLLYYLSFTCFLLFLLCFPKTAAEYAKTGLMLWFNTLLPSMLPFMILSGLLIKTGFLEKLLSFTGKFWEKAFGLTPLGGYGLLMGIFCGYPMGAKTAADLYRNQRISRQEASYLLTFSNHPGPAFLSSYLCTELLHQEDLVLPAYIILYLSSFLTSLLFRPFYSFPKGNGGKVKKRGILCLLLGRSPGHLYYGQFSLDHQTGGIYHSIFPFSGNPAASSLASRKPEKSPPGNYGDHYRSSRHR